MAGAVRGAAKARVKPPKVLAVTVLTSLSDAELAIIGHEASAPRVTHRLAELAIDSGVDGLVCSAQRAAEIRARFGPQPFLCTPGIRTPGDSRGDQVSHATPAEAIRAGADLLVVGRPIYAAADPVQAAGALCAAVAGAV
jgi:orotidine-5'-phosphate decarboxylase